MSSLLIEGGRADLRPIEVEGNKNAALPLLAACLLTTEECVLTNMPRIGDVEVMAKLLNEDRRRGARDRHDDGSRALQGHQDVRAEQRAGRASLRGSVLLLGPLLARTGRAILGMPGGDFPARRTIGTHIDALVNLGATVLPSSGHALEAPRRPARGVDVSGRSVRDRHGNRAAGGGDDRGRHGDSPCRNRAARRRGLRVSRRAWASASRAQARRRFASKGTKRLRGVTHQLNGDYIEAGSWAVVAAVTGGEIEVRGARAEDVEGIAFVLKRMNVACTFEDGLMTIQKSKPVAAGRITTGLWPSFPSDFVSLVTVLATQADGRTLIHDWMYELRLFALEQLSGMRADLFLCDPHRIIVTGPQQVEGTQARQPGSCDPAWR